MRRPVLLAALTALAVRALVIIKLPATPSWDGAIYVRLAEHLAHGMGYVDGAPAHPTAFYPVGYPALVAMVSWITGNATTAAWVINALAAAVAAACAAWLGHRIAGTRGAYVSGMSYALAPGPALWTVATMTETLTGALLVAAIGIATVPVTATRSRLQLSGLAGALLGLAALARPQAILATPFVGALPPAPRSTRMLAAAACVVAAFAIVLPWTARNCATMHTCSLVSTNGGPNLLLGTLPDARGGYRALTPADGCPDVFDEVARDRCMTRLALSRVGHDPLTWMQLALLKVGRTFATEWAPVSYLRAAIPGAFPGRSASRAALICGIWWWALMVGGAVGGVRAARAGGRSRVLVQIALLNVVLFALTHAVFIGDDRYHLPLVPLLSSLAAGVLLPSRPNVEPDLVWAS